jgi:uncharacterized protein
MSGDRFVREAMAGNLRAVRRLIAGGTNVDSYNRCGVTALMIACFWGRSSVVRFLLKSGADVGLIGALSGCTALTYACLSGNPELVALLLERQAPVNSTDKSGKTALMAAAAIGDAEVVKMLLNYGADVNHRDRLGTTALDHAQQGGHRDVVNLLVANDTGRAPSDASIREVQWL